MKIKQLILETRNLEAQIEFYSKVLKFEIVFRNGVACSFLAGDSLLTFRADKKSTPYHFAFNIPSNKEKEALIWLKQRARILSFDGSEIISFKSWNSKAIYFYDKDKNIVEFIARKNLNRNSFDTFSSKSILNISEIGLASRNLKQTYETVNSMRSINLYSGSFEKFCALGNEEGMFIMVHPNLKEWFPNDDKIFQSDFIIRGDYNFKFSQGALHEIN
jgi:catechol-2,3-dioxygenase